MLTRPAEKYRSFPLIDLPDRQWPSRQLTRAPRWLSTDLRDGNQALAEPMDPERKMAFWDLLLRCGFREIEVAFPSASQTDFDFVRELIEQQRIPQDVTLQVLTQAREDLIARTFEALQGAPRAIVHLYNATAPLFRERVFKQSKAEIVALATAGAARIRAGCEAQPDTHWTFEYSPETFCFTEPAFCAGNLRGGRRCLATRCAAADDHQPARDRRGEHAQRLRRSDRIFLPPLQSP